MIPVLIVPVYKRWDLAERMLRSIDGLVERIIVVNNDGMARNLNHLHGEGWLRYSETDYIEPLINLGFGGAINTAIAQTPDSEWWMWASQDITFGTGDLHHIAARIAGARGPRVVTGDRSDDRLLRFAYAAINRECIEAVGLLDEWVTAPGYFEDDDFERRCQLGGVDWTIYNGNISHERSALLNSDHAAQRGNSLTFPRNLQRYAAKWGGPPGQERYQRPYDRPVPLSYVQVDLAYRGWALAQWSDAK